MKTIQLFITTTLLFAGTALMAQVQINKPIQLTGGSGERVITNLETPVNGTDAVNKDYVDAAVAAAGGGAPTMVSDESSATMNLGDALRYCDTLSASGYTDWKLPAFDELLGVLSNPSAPVPNNTSANYIQFIPFSEGANTRYGFNRFRLSDGIIDMQTLNTVSSLRVRCVR